MHRLSNIHIACLVLAVMMLLAVIPCPYGYYVLVRFAAMVVFGYMAFSLYSERRMEYAIVAGVLALLFQPFVKVALGREVWQVVDVLVGICLIGFVVWDRKRKPAAATTSVSSSAATIANKWSTGGYDVFISYSTRDRFDSTGRPIPGNIIDRMMEELDKAGITYWIDKKGLIGGATFPAEIAKQIKNAKCMVYVSSANSNVSTWTMNEIATANTYGKPIIPFRIDHSTYNPAIMIYLAAVHHIVYPGNPNAFRQLVESVKKAK